MRPLHLRLKGPTRYTSELILDLREVPPGIVAVVGGNGQGKTTLIEAMATIPLFLELPSYPGKLADGFNADVRDGQVDVLIEWGGHEYRHLVQVDPAASGGRGKAEAFLYRDGEALDTPGRLADYQAAVGAIYPPRELFYAAAFSVQTGAGNWFDLDRVQRRDLFAQLLGLGHLQQLAERARDHRKACDSAAGDLDREAERLVEDRANHANLLGLRAARAASVEDLAGQLAQVEQEHQEAIQVKADAQAQADTLRQAFNAAVEARQRLEARRNDATRKLEATRNRIGALDEILGKADETRKHAAELERLTTQARQVESDLAAARGEAAAAEARYKAAGATMNANREQIQSLLERLGQADELAASVEAGKARLEELDEARAQVALLEGADEALAQAVESRRAAGEAQADAFLRRRDATQALTSAQEQAARLQDVPCGGRVLYVSPGGISDGMAASSPEPYADCGRCQFLADAQAAAGRLAELKAQVEATGEAVTAANEGLEVSAAAQGEAEDKAEQLRAARSKARELSWVPDHLAGLERRIEALAGERAKLAELKDRQVEVRAEWNREDEQAEQARAAVSALLRSLEGLDKLKAQVAGADRELRKLEQAQAERPHLDAQVEDSRGLIAQVDEDLAALVVPSADVHRQALSRLADTGRTLDQAAARLAQARQATQDARDDLARVSGRLDELGDVEARGQDLETRRQALDLRRNGWVLLERALGRDGIQALEIDAAGPEVSEVVNELLAACFGRRFSCSLRTVQEAGGGKVQREVFDLQILDGLRGGEARDAARYSVGERTLISEALKLGLAVFNARRSTTPIRTLWRDECDGPLEPDLANAYPAMLRRAMELGGYDRVYLISHREAVWSQADTLIRVDGGRAWIER